MQLSLCNVSVSFKLMKNNDVFGIAKAKRLKLQIQGKVIVYFRNGLLGGLERLRYRFSLQFAFINTSGSFVKFVSLWFIVDIPR